MDSISQTVLSLLRAVLWKEEPSFPEDTDWNAVTKELNMQAVLGVVAGGELPRSVPAKVREQWEYLALIQGMRFYQLLHAQDELLALLNAHGIYPVILKGMAAAVYYPSPEMRAMGDVDFLAPRKQVDEALTLMLANGYELVEEESACLKRFRELRNNKHFLMQKDGHHFELHRYFGVLDLTAKMQWMDALLQEGMQRREQTLCCGSQVPMLPKLANGLVLLQHAAGHAQGGIGLRHVMDWMMYVHTCLTDEFWQESFAAAARMLGLENFAKVMTRMCQLYLGLPASASWCCDADHALCGQLLHYVLEQGNFGLKQSNVDERIKRLLSEPKSIGQWLRLLQLSGMNHWEAAKKYAILKPFAWMYGCGRYAHLALGRNQALGRLHEEKQEGDRRSKLLKDLGILLGEKQVFWMGDQFVEHERK